jgi:FdhE protein
MSIINHAEYLTKQNNILSSSSLSEEMYFFYQSLFSLQYNAMRGFISNMTSTTLIVNTTHYPIIHPQNMQLTEEIVIQIKNLYKDVATLITQFQPGYSFNTFLTNLDADPQLYKEIILSLLLKENAIEAIAYNNKIGTDELIFLAINVYKPLFVALRTVALADTTDFPEHTQGWCPFCGFLPDMAKIVESKTNKRFLHCALCECEWEYKRVKCVACGNENIDTLGYYSYEPDEKYRFDYCNKCNTYIKTIRITKQLEESQFDLTVENLFTNFLDASALQMGYTRQ